MTKPETLNGQHAFYRTDGVRLMNLIEAATGKLMHEVDRDLEEKFWKASDDGNTPELKKRHREIAELHDRVTMDEEKRT